MIKSPSFSGGRFILLALVTLFVTLLVAILGLILLAAVLLEILILVIHIFPPRRSFCGWAAYLVSPLLQALSFGLNNKLASKPAITATVIPAADAVSPPVNIPRNPSVMIAFLTPFAIKFPKPVNGTDAPAPANSTNLSYIPVAPNTTPDTT